jgi:serine protease Do
MDRIKIAIAVIFAAVSFFVGLNLASDSNLQEVDNRSLPSFNSEVLPSDEVPIRTLRDFNDAMVNIAERTNPTVVTITTVRTFRVRQQNPFGFFFDDPRFRQEREEQREGLGSGVIVSEDGYIITNNHVIDQADEIKIILYNGDELDAEIVGTDPGSDIAVLRVDAEDLSAISMGNSDEIRVGEMVLAIGSPLSRDLAQTVSKGIVSASGRSSLGLNAFENYIQTDAAINPGNSGGALVNMDGQLIGINTAIASRSGGNQGIGFAIPVNMVREVMEALITDGRVARGYLGLWWSSDVDETMARALGMERAVGFVVSSVEKDGPADQAGIQEGDVIMSLNGEEVKDWTDFRVEIGTTPPGETITLEIFRDGERITLDVVLGENNPEEIAGTMSDDDLEELKEALGFDVAELNDSIRRQLRLDADVEGVVVSSISQGSRSYRQGLRRGDVITQVSNQQVTTADEFFGTIRGLMQDGTEAVLLRVQRQGRSVFIAIEL